MFDGYYIRICLTWASTVNNMSVFAPICWRLREAGLSKRRFVVALNRILNSDESYVCSPGNRIFLGTGMGRSGTRFLSKLLNRAPSARVVHEPVDEDIAAFRHGYCSPQRRRRYVQSFRIPETNLRLGGDPPIVYGEVNSHLRRHVGAIRELCPSIQIFQLVRDGRDVVRSMYSRKTMTSGDRTTYRVRPCRGDPFRDQWDALSRFEKLCWYWSSANAFVRPRSDWTVRLEDVVTDYEWLDANLLDPLGLKLERSVWRNEIAIQRNVTDSHVLPLPENWEARRKQRFWEICGEEMRKYGYE